MKKILAFALALLVVASMAACSKDPEKDPTENPDNTPDTEQSDDNTPEVPDDTTPEGNTPEDTTPGDDTPPDDGTDVTPETPTDDLTPTNEQVYARITVDLRSAPSVDASNVVGKLRYAQLATRIGVSEDWSKILFEGNEYYVATNCLNLYDPENPPVGGDEPIVDPDDLTPPEGGEGDDPVTPPADGTDDFVALPEAETVYVIAEGALNLRAEPSTTSAVVDRLAFGKQLQRIATNSAWSKVLYEGKECYVFSEYVTTDDIHATGYTELAAPQTMYVTASSLWVRYYPSMIEASIVPYTEHPGLHLGDVVSRVAISPDGTWSRVIINGNTYYVGSAYLSTTAPDGFEDIVPDDDPYTGK
jgi:uncharacterized protein YgiM (DUF1202 family)